jgi:hypothetical protein
MSARAPSVPRSGVAPRWATRRTRRATYGGKVVKVAAALGLDLLPWQRRVVDVALEHHRGELVYRDVVISVPRQSGKSTLVLVVIAHRLLASHCAAVYGAQTRLAARQKLLDDWWPVLRRSPLSKLFDVSRATGQESLFALGGTGSRCRVISSDETAAHGQTASLGVLDESWSPSARHWSRSAAVSCGSHRRPVPPSRCGGATRSRAAAKPSRPTGRRVSHTSSGRLSRGPISRIPRCCGRFIRRWT